MINENRDDRIYQKVRRNPGFLLLTGSGGVEARACSSRSVNGQVAKFRILPRTGGKEYLQGKAEWPIPTMTQDK